MNFNIFWVLSFALLFVTSCKDDKKTNEDATPHSTNKAVIPRINADSAFSYVEKQLSFGVRVPGTTGHTQTKDWIIHKMKSYGAEVEVQPFKATFLGKKDVPSYNIIASVNPSYKKRVLLMAHWDTRLIAEKDADPEMQTKAIPGAIDGASGVAALLEIARNISLNEIELGVDFIFFDAEDQGENGDNWCIGSKYWSENPHKKGYTAEFGILLDLIGAKGATYGYEAYSYQFAPNILKKVWALAQGMGYGQLFMVYDGGGVMDDHYYVNTIRKIPSIDIIETNKAGGFGSYHHTHDDNIDAMDIENFRSVIQVVTAVIYKVSDGSF
ncbi:MAG: M28 family peptidase [Saprospiraceae bacterium]|nr:M28 family peptidase [Saprospiraceae bacterium]